MSACDSAKLHSRTPDDIGSGCGDTAEGIALFSLQRRLGYGLADCGITESNNGTCCLIDVAEFGTGTGIGTVGEVCTAVAELATGTVAEVCTGVVKGCTGTVAEVCTGFAKRRTGTVAEVCTCAVAEVCTGVAKERTGTVAEVCTTAAELAAGTVAEVCTVAVCGSAAGTVTPEIGREHSASAPLIKMSNR